LVLDVASGSLHQVDDGTFGALKLINEKAYLYSKPFSVADFFADPANNGLVSDSIKGDILALAEAGQLFSPDNPHAAHSHMETRQPVVKAMCLHMAHECNLRCGYCFAGDGTYSGEGLSDRGLMPAEVGKKALDFLIENSGARRNLEVDFFGGEPMLNFDAVKEVVAHGRKREAETGKKFRFTLTTNGALLNEEANKYINENMDNVVLSLDGRKEVNDNMRRLNKGGGSYDTILPKIKALAESRGQKNYYVRGTYTCHNLDFAADVLHMASCGFKQLSVEPVVAPQDADYALTEEHLPQLFAEYEKLADSLLERERAGEGVHFFHFEMDLDGGPCLAKRVTGCGAGAEYLAVTPSGQLYPCHQFVMDQSFRLGDLDSGIINKTLVSDFSACHVFAKSECLNCWAKYYCSGGCMATAHHMNGHILKPDKVSCELQKKRIECALYMAAARV